MWMANICLRSGKYLLVEDLQSINELSGTGPTITKITNFDEYHLLKDQKLSFIGKSAMVTLLAGDIEYVQISERN